MRAKPPSRNRTFAKSMRADGTMAERKLWFKLRDRRLDGLKFRRQVPIGGYIVDFVCFDCGLIVELDGGQHNENLRDALRDVELRKRGFTILRFWNNEVNGDILAVLDRIAHAAGALGAHRMPQE
jgi:very-short-patch-repair endonuclease